MKIKYEPGKEPPPPVPTFEELFAEIKVELERINYTPSVERQHAIESQLRGVIRRAGFRFRETSSKPLSLKEIHDQALIGLNSIKWEFNEKVADTVLLLAQAVLSNLKAESIQQKEVEKEIPFA